MNLLRLISSILALSILVGCAATGEKFISPSLINKDSATVYFMRKDKFVGAAACRIVLINDVDSGCIKSGGFLKLNVSAGNQNIKIPKLTKSDWADEASIDTEFVAGTIYYFEWTNELENYYVLPIGALILTGGKTNNTLIKHKKESALVILNELRNSVGKG